MLNKWIKYFAGVSNRGRIYLYLRKRYIFYCSSFYAYSYTGDSAGLRKLEGWYIYLQCHWVNQHSIFTLFYCSTIASPFRFLLLLLCFNRAKWNERTRKRRVTKTSNRVSVYRVSNDSSSHRDSNFPNCIWDGTTRLVTRLERFNHKSSGIVYLLLSLVHFHYPIRC